MYNELIHLIKQNFDIDITKIEILVDHTDSKVYSLESLTEKYALKEMGANNKLENESELNKHLISKGIKVPKIYYTTTGAHIIYNNELMYILYEFIEGKIYDLNTAPDWYLIKQAQTLGQIQNALRDYKQLGLGFGQNFFSEEKNIHGEKIILEKIKQAEEKHDIALTTALNERLKHIKRVSCFEFNCNKLTYVNTHGDLYINQIIVRDGELIVIDWTHPGCLLACFEVIMSYVYAAPECKDGIINIDKFKPILSEYLKYTKLNHYDLKMMPYFLYFYCVFCSFMPPYDDLPIDYFKIANLTDNLANWLYDNVEKLSSEIIVV
jgi:tRNA A-37 threonylcarbamoyl transferase component Bud32